MMSFEDFVNEVKEEVAARTEDFEIKVKKVSKCNGLVLTGLTIAKKEGGLAPVIYLDSLYQSYISENEEVSLTSVVESIEAAYRDNEQETHRLYGSLGNLDDYREVRDKIAFKLINTEENRELLKAVPSIPFQDLSIVFYLYIEERAEGIWTALVHKEHMKLWEVTEAELFREAEKNTPRLLPETLRGMDEVMESLGITDKDGDTLHGCSSLSGADAPLLYVLTNRMGIDGAACLLYPGVMKKCADKLKSDLLILPSSIHELLLLPFDGGINVDKMRDIVQSVNASEVSVEDRLSGEVYLYCRSKNRVELAGQTGYGMSENGENFSDAIF